MVGLSITRYCIFSVVYTILALVLEIKYMCFRKITMEVYKYAKYGITPKWNTAEFVTKRSKKSYWHPNEISKHTERM